MRAREVTSVRPEPAEGSHASCGSTSSPRTDKGALTTNGRVSAHHELIGEHSLRNAEGALNINGVVTSVRPEPVEGSHASCGSTSSP